MAKIIEIIEAETTRGRGTDNDPIRLVTQFFDKEGNLLWEYDSERNRKLTALGFNCASSADLPFVVDALIAKLSAKGHSA